MYFESFIKCDTWGGRQGVLYCRVVWVWMRVTRCSRGSYCSCWYFVDVWGSSWEGGRVMSSSSVHRQSVASLWAGHRGRLRTSLCLGFGLRLGCCQVRCGSDCTTCGAGGIDCCACCGGGASPTGNDGSDEYAENVGRGEEMREEWGFKGSRHRSPALGPTFPASNACPKFLLAHLVATSRGKVVMSAGTGCVKSFLKPVLIWLETSREKVGRGSTHFIILIHYFQRWYLQQLLQRQ